MMRRFTLRLPTAGLDDLELKMSQAGTPLWLPEQLGQLQLTGRGADEVPQILGFQDERLNGTISAGIGNTQLPLFRDYLEKQKGSERGHIILRNEYFYVNESQASLNNRTPYGAPRINGNYVERFYECYVLIFIRPDYLNWVAYNATLGDMWEIVFDIEELTA